LKLVTEESAFAMFQLPGREADYVELFGIDDPDAAYITTGPVPGFLVDDVVQARKELEASGVEMVEPLRWMVDVDPALVEAKPRLASRSTAGSRFAAPTATSITACRGRWLSRNDTARAIRAARVSHPGRDDHAQLAEPMVGPRREPLWPRAAFAQ
jgi:hypothetical protein